MSSDVQIDLVTVFHNDVNTAQYANLCAQVREFEPEGGFRLIGVDNRVKNRGFARGCNIGAFHPDATAPIIGFLNPDVHVTGPFISTVVQSLVRPVVIAGCRFNKPANELRIWGVREWVCGAAMFVNRKWFTTVGGFDTQFVWSWDDTDLCRQAESQAMVVRALKLPIDHESPSENTEKDAAYKRLHFDRGHKRYVMKWRGRERA